MPNDIKKAIEIAKEKLKDKYLSKLRETCPKELNDQIASADYEQGFNDASLLLLSQWEESTRWRKVEEELPEYTGNPFLVRGYFKIGDRVKFGIRYFTAFIDHDFYKVFNQIMFDTPRHFVITEWQPINK